MVGAGPSLRRCSTPWLPVHQTGDVAETLNVDADGAAKKLARWAEAGWVRRVRRGLYIGVPVHVTNPAAWSEDPLLVAAEIWVTLLFHGVDGRTALGAHRAGVPDNRR